MTCHPLHHRGTNIIVDDNHDEEDDDLHLEHDHLCDLMPPPDTTRSPRPPPHSRLATSKLLLLQLLHQVSLLLAGYQVIDADDQEDVDENNQTFADSAIHSTIYSPSQSPVSSDSSFQSASSQFDFRCTPRFNPGTDLSLVSPRRTTLPSAPLPPCPGEIFLFCIRVSISLFVCN